MDGMMDGRETVRASLYFQTPSRFARDLPGEHGSDFYNCGMNPSPDDRQTNGTDEWGCVWATLADTHLGEVQSYPLKTWDDLPRLSIPDFLSDHRWEGMQAARAKANGRYMLGNICSLYERLHFLRGLENLWCDILEEPERVSALLDILVESNIKVVRRYARYGVDGIMFTDDWGLQDRLMIRPALWREIWKPAYRRVFDAAHSEGIDCWMHSCGYIVDILDDLIEIGLNAVHMDQQENMGLDNLCARFRGRINFFACVDIQKTMVTGSPDEIRAYARKMAACLGTKEGGFIPRWYTDPVGAGHKQESIDIMCEEFLKIDREIYGG